MQQSLLKIRTAVERIYQNLKTTEQQAANSIASVHAQQTKSATNLLHYLALRRDDLRVLQNSLHNAGLSSLASSESHILRQVQAVLQRLGTDFPPQEILANNAAAGTQLLRRHATTLFGPNADPEIPYLMVTFDTNMAEEYATVKALVQAGMNIARINSAHDNAAVWKKMIANVRQAERATGRSCKIYFDLSGPKIRTVLTGKARHKGRLKLREQETFFLAEADTVFDTKQKVVGCTLPGVVKDVRPGQRVLFDDGLFEAIVEKAGTQVATLRMTRISAAKPRLKPEKGINFPDTQLTVPCLTDYDKSLLPFAQSQADILGFSFVRAAADVLELQELLRENKGRKLPIVLKIETFEAVQHLPALLLQGMAEPVFGVMIARGDLAVEIGFERLSEIQEEILWLCEAAHAPVIWATQVLETMNKTGIATRAELSDASLAAQAECVMLNKGKYLLVTLAALRDILHRSGTHHLKKRNVFRNLKIAARFLDEL